MVMIGFSDQGHVTNVYTKFHRFTTKLISVVPYKNVIGSVGGAIAPIVKFPIYMCSGAGTPKTIII